MCKLLSEFSKKKFSNDCFISISIDIDDVNDKQILDDRVISVYDFIKEDGSNIEVNLNLNTELFRIFLSSV